MRFHHSHSLDTGSLLALLIVLGAVFAYCIRPSSPAEVSYFSAVCAGENPPSKIQDCIPTSPSVGYRRRARQSVPKTGLGDMVITRALKV